MNKLRYYFTDCSGFILYRCNVLADAIAYAARTGLEIKKAW